VQEADAVNAILEPNRFKMTFSDFREVICNLRISPHRQRLPAGDCLQNRPHTIAEALAASRICISTETVTAVHGNGTA
jgi:hypothetical protein